VCWSVGITRPRFSKRDSAPKYDNKSKYGAGDFWKAQQLKEYRRDNGLCFMCGEKNASNYQFAPPAQFKTMELNEDFVLLSNGFLEAKLLTLYVDCPTSFHQIGLLVLLLVHET
jgi:hypothetical protein